MFDKNYPFNDLPDLPPLIDLETPQIMKASIKANRLLAELKGYCQILPEPNLLINTLVLQESRDSSAIENIVTTQDELYTALIAIKDEFITSQSTKEVISYREALYHGWERLKENNLLTTNILISIMQVLKNTNASVRIGTGVKLVNDRSKTTIYTPPEGEGVIRKKLQELEKYIHDPKDDLDPLIRMALIHYQFESIHPFADGNGRTGRILNILYLVQQNLLDIPVLYLSKFIVNNKNEYYQLLKDVTEKGEWEAWILYNLEAVAQTSLITLQKITQILNLKNETVTHFKEILPKNYSADLINLIFSHPYIKIKTLEQYQIAKRATAATYLNALSSVGILSPIKVGREIYYINKKLMNIITAD